MLLVFVRSKVGYLILEHKMYLFGAHVEIEHLIRLVRFLEPVSDTIGIKSEVIFKLDIQELLNGVGGVVLEHWIVEIVHSSRLICSQINYF